MCHIVSYNTLTNDSYFRQYPIRQLPLLDRCSSSLASKGSVDKGSLSDSTTHQTEYLDIHVDTGGRISQYLLDTARRKWLTTWSGQTLWLMQQEVSVPSRHHHPVALAVEAHWQTLVKHWPRQWCSRLVVQGGTDQSLTSHLIHYQYIIPGIQLLSIVYFCYNFYNSFVSAVNPTSWCSVPYSIHAEYYMV